ncbi:hypothetical protein [Pseudomonas lactis]|uniref:hypothetical protein n=1 Tax=Pseudomonas lactis TaxID=1615674 RepID=UPI00110C75B2|nr:hypothetical protein [Pseudomonas lactis]MBK3446162.1 hypothetical protein [Pseudomonas lactis]
MSNQAQVDALEHLLIAVLKSSITNGLSLDHLVAKAQGSLLGSDGPGSPTEKAQAVSYLNHIAAIAGR